RRSTPGGRAGPRQFRASGGWRFATSRARTEPPRRPLGGLNVHAQRRTKDRAASRPRPLMSSRIRPLLGLGVLLLTMVAGYVASRVAGTHDRSHVINVSAALDAHIKAVANRYGVSADLIVAIIEAESSFNPRAVSRRGARGLMQLMPETAASLGVGDPFDPRENIEGGVRHLRALMDQFDNNMPRVLAAYNSGRPAAIEQRGT